MRQEPKISALLARLAEIDLLFVLISKTQDDANQRCKLRREINDETDRLFPLSRAVHGGTRETCLVWLEDYAATRAQELKKQIETITEKIQTDRPAHRLAN